ncbi:MAG: MnhB domain-containing protein [Hyphomonadaceae bacterium]
MKPGAHVVAAAATRLYTPLITLFALFLLIAAAPGSGAGFVAGLAFGLALLLHALVFGAAEARAAIPAPLPRLLLAGGAILALVSAGLNGFVYATQLIEAGIFAATIGAGAIVIQVVFGRAPTLRDEIV